MSNETLFRQDGEARQAAVYDHENNIFLVAGAGTGKTHTLVHRIVSLIFKGKTTIDRLVAMTFTESAAMELKGRVRSELHNAYSNKTFEDIPLTQPQLALVREAIRGVDSAQITTIHSFCLTLLRERPVEVKIDPNSSMMDALDSVMFLDHEWESWVRQEMNGKPEGLRIAVDLGVSLDQLKQLAFVLYRDRDIVTAPEFSPAKAVCNGPTDSPDQFMDHLKSRTKVMKQLIADHCSNDSDKGAERILAICDQLIELESLDIKSRDMHLFRGVKIRGGKAGTPDNWASDICDEQQALRDKTKSELEELRCSMAAVYAEQIEAWAKGFVDHIEKRKTKTAKLDFQDLLVKTRDHLRDNLELRSYFQDKIDTILVDEFQDTDPLQAEIVFFLAEQKPIATAWDKVKLGQGRLFIVGDPKQSIYRFRRADIELFERVRKLVVEQGGVKHSIVKNYRSLEQPIDWVNKTFEQVIQKSTDGDYQPEYEELLVAEDTPPLIQDQPGVIRLLDTTPEDTTDLAIGQARALEADQVAACIAHLVSTGHQVRQRGSGRGNDTKWDEVTYGDIAILIPGFTELSLYEDALNAHGISYRIEGGKDYYKKQEPRALSAALQAIADPSNHVALLAAARSFLFGVSDDELARFRGDIKYFDYTSIDPERLSAHPTIAHCFSVLRDLNQSILTQKPHEIAEELIRRTTALAIAATQKDGPQRVQNLRKVVEVARHAGGNGQLSLREFAYWLEIMDRDEKDEEESPGVDESSPQVTIMSIHKSKGLEFPVVILANTAGAGSKKYDPLFVDRNKLQYELRVMPKNSKQPQIATGEYPSIKEADDTKRAAERKRLAYVAATRARDLLILSDQTTWADGEPELQGFREFMPQLDTTAEVADLSFTPEQIQELRAAAPGADTERVEFTPSAEARTAWLADRSAAIDGATRLTSTSASQLKQESVKPDREVPRRPKGSSSKNRGTISATDFGKLFHRVMEVADFSDQEGAESLARSYASSAALSEEETGNLIRLVTNCFNSEIIQRAAGADRVWKETPFSVRLPAPVAESSIGLDLARTLLFEGVIDLLFEEDGMITIVDYKSDTVEESGLSEKLEMYRTQGEIYAAAATEITNKRVKGCSFLFAALGVTAST